MSQIKALETIFYDFLHDDRIKEAKAKLLAAIQSYSFWPLSTTPVNSKSSFNALLKVCEFDTERVLQEVEKLSHCPLPKKLDLTKSFLA
ncbi:hypothetical protein MJD09_13020 [bacterium]|nr:hypothetical protein [bacterium]